MVVELKTFGQVLFPKNKAVKKTPDLKPLVVTVKAPNKEAAATIGLGKIACSKYAEFPDAVTTLELARALAQREGRPISGALRGCATALASRATHTALRDTLETMSKSRFPDTQIARIRDCIRRMEKSLERAQKQLRNMNV